MSNPRVSNSRLAIVVGLILTAGLCVEVSARTVSIEVDSRKGVGLIPAFWRGVAPSGPDDISRDRVTWERIDPTLVVASWQERIGGGGPGWFTLNKAIDRARAEGRRVILTIPVAAAPNEDDVWRKRVSDTVKRTFELVDRYELSADGVEDIGRFLRYYESGAWAAYQGHHKAVIGGPGADWKRDLIHPFIRHCVERSLPLGFVSWHVAVTNVADPLDAYHRVESAIDAVAPSSRPEALVSKWGLADGAADPVYLTCGALRYLLGTELAAACIDPGTSPWGAPAFKAFNELGSVQIPMTVSHEGVGGVASMEGDAVLLLLWRKHDTGPIEANLSLSGMRWGRAYDYERVMIQTGKAPPRAIEKQSLRAVDPLELTFPIPAGRATLIRIVPE
tara:strand:- start:208 stop:1380 length:1173 start_codon:yes stop_codon:yes gene_type:complete